MVKDFVPDRGDIVWLDFTPQSGHEQMGKRPALVLTPKEYNIKAGLAIFCPITSRIKNYPFEVRIESANISGVVLSDQIKSMDWVSRKAEFICKAGDREMEEVFDKVSALLF